jgi:hypothetical protein
MTPFFPGTPFPQYTLIGVDLCGHLRLGCDVHCSHALGSVPLRRKTKGMIWSRPERIDDGIPAIPG